MSFMYSNRTVGILMDYDSKRCQKVFNLKLLIHNYVCYTDVAT